MKNPFFFIYFGSKPSECVRIYHRSFPPRFGRVPSSFSATSRKTQNSKKMSHFRKYFQLGVSFLILGGGGGYLYPKIKDALKFQEQSQTPPQETQGNLNVAMEVNFYLKMINNPDNVNEKKFGVYRLLLRLDPDRAPNDSFVTPKDFRINTFNLGGPSLMDALNHSDPALNQLAADAWYYLSQEESLRDKISGYSLTNFVDLIKNYRKMDMYVICRLCDTISFLVTHSPKTVEKVVDLGLLSTLCHIASTSYKKSNDHNYKRVSASAFGTIEKIVSSFPIDSIESLNLSRTEIKTVVKAFELIGLSHCDSKELFISSQNKKLKFGKEIPKLAMRNVKYCLALCPNNFGIPYRIGTRLYQNGFHDEAAECPTNRISTKC